MIDFIELTKFCSPKVTPNFGNCKIEKTYPDGVCFYRLYNGENHISVIWKPNGVLTIRGSLAYFLFGHNLHFTLQDFENAIITIGKELNVYLWDADVTEVELGVIIKVEEEAKQYIARHHSADVKLLEYNNPEYKGNLRLFKYGKNFDIKMYGVNERYKAKRIDICEVGGLETDSNYLKFEVRYKNPEQLNSGCSITPETFLDTDKYAVFLYDLCSKYELLEVSNVKVAYPQNPTTLLIILNKYMQLCLEGKLSPNEAKNRLISEVNEIDGLDKGQRESKRKTIRNNCKMLTIATDNEYSIGDYLEDEIDKELRQEEQRLKEQ